MTNRERVLTTLRRKEPDKVPMHFVLCPSQLDTFKEKTKVDNPDEYFNLGISYVEPLGSNQKNDFFKYTSTYPADANIDEWGIGRLGTSSSHHFEHIYHPLQEVASVKEIEEYPYPDVDADYRYEGLVYKVNELKQKGFAVVGDAVPQGGTVFWPAYKLRSMECLLVDFVNNQKLAYALLEQISSRVATMAEKLAKTSIDILRLADDLGTQIAPLMSPNTFRALIKPHLKKIIEKAKKIKPDLLIFFHSDGAIKEFIPDLIEIGVDILNPVQPECMDPTEIKKEYGNHLALWGTIGTQTTMPFGSAELVREVVKSRIENVGYGGGFLISPTHIIEPEVPWENIMAFVQAVKDFGTY